MSTVPSEGSASSRGRAGRERSLSLGETSRAAYERAGNEERAAAVARCLREHSR